MSRPDVLPSSVVSVYVHVYETSEFVTRYYPNIDRVSVDVAGSGGTVALFLGQAEIARLRAELEQADRVLSSRGNDTNRARVISGPAA